jgi:DNA modification methylase
MSVDKSIVDAGETAPRSAQVAYATPKGTMFKGNAEHVLLCEDVRKKTRNKVQLILTSPPFPLNRKKKYGNKVGNAYQKWFADFAPIFSNVLKSDGSIVIEMGNAWEPGKPVMSTLGIRALLDFLDEGGFYLCQEFVWYNPARLPTPAQWVNVDRIRVKDAYTHLWWMSRTEKPKANNKRVLKPYSESMERLLRTKTYNAGKRPSEHNIGAKSFLTDNKGAIPPNVLTFSNTTNKDPYLIYCKEHELKYHPARMPIGVAEFFVKFLTETNDLVMDPFAGSNTTGAAAEGLKRRWIAIESDDDYIEGSCGRFDQMVIPLVTGSKSLKRQ